MSRKSVMDRSKKRADSGSPPLRCWKVEQIRAAGVQLEKHVGTLVQEETAEAKDACAVLWDPLPHRARVFESSGRWEKSAEPLVPKS